jgi:23S rRNA maturation mini-RNase III
MLGLPRTTEFNKRIPKEKFYENLNVTPALKKCFVDQIKAIFWRNKIAATTTNLAAGATVTEIEVFEINLKSNLLDEGVLRQIDKEIPYHILFLLEYEGRYQAWTAYKEASASNTAFKVAQYYHTDWMPLDALPLALEGLTTDAVYESFVRQIAGEQLQTASGDSLKESVEKAEYRSQLEKKIEVLQGKIRKEKQLNVQMKLNGELKKLKKELEVLE